MITHIIMESESPPDALVWHMWCGVDCIARDNGELIPLIDFYGEKDAKKATCAACHAVHMLHTVATSMRERAPA